MFTGGLVPFFMDLLFFVYTPFISSSRRTTFWKYAAVNNNDTAQIGYLGSSLGVLSSYGESVFQKTPRLFLKDSLKRNPLFLREFLAHHEPLCDRTNNFIHPYLAASQLALSTEPINQTYGLHPTCNFTIHFHFNPRPQPAASSMPIWQNKFKWIQLAPLE